MGKRKDGTNLRALGANPRSLGLNPRALGTNPRGDREDSIIDMLEAEGWYVARRGFPYFLAARGERLKVFEAEREVVRPRIEQPALMDFLLRLGIETEVVRS